MPAKKGSCMKKYIMELIGALFLVLTYSMVGNPLAIGTMLAVLVYMGAHISGSHYNPAVSLAMWLRGKLGGRDMLFYMFFQLLGAFLAAGIYFLLAGKHYYPSPAPGIGYWKIFLVELLFTFFFVFVFLTVFTAKKFKANGMYGLIIGFAILPVVFLGGTYNPVISVGPALLNLASGGMAIKHVPAYLLGTLTGGVLSTLFYRYIYCEEFRK